MQGKKILIASDHGGFSLKENLKAYLQKTGYEVIDYGTNSVDSVNYPDFAKLLAAGIKEKTAARGILICTSGIGMSIAANRYPFIRAALVHSVEESHLARAHNDANVLVFGAKFIEPKIAQKCIDEFLTTEFEGGRHTCRVQALERME